MEENKTTIETEDLTKIETVEQVEVVAETEDKKVENNTTEAKNVADTKKHPPKKVWMIVAIAFLALAVIAAAVVYIILNGQKNILPEEEEENYVQISIEDISKYTLICAAGTSNKTMTQYWKLQSQIKNMCGVKIVTETDNNVEAADFEILVGNTDREESKNFLSNLLWLSYFLFFVLF